MDIIRRTEIWRRTLADQPSEASDVDRAFRSRLREGFISVRRRAETLAGEIPRDIRDLTVHGMDHIDPLWQVADILLGHDYSLTPTEAFVLGGAFLLHDLGMALAAYPGGLEELKQDCAWKDAVAQVLRKRGDFGLPRIDLVKPGVEVEREAVERVLRLRHAKYATVLASREFRHHERDQSYFLVEDADLRQAYGELIGKIAYSHWWSIDRLAPEFDKVIGAFPGSPEQWTIDPLKIACIVRTADACHLDSRRAPGFLRALRKPVGEAEAHWRFQEYVQTPVAENGRIVFAATKEMPVEDVDVWWLGFELLRTADQELRDVDALLRDSRRSPFAVRAVAGAGDPKRLIRYFPTAGWNPVSVRIHATDVASLVRTLGGRGLYGENPRVPLRELIQNARDAVIARRFKEYRPDSWGDVVVRLVSDETGDCIEVDDTGLGMSEDLLTGPFLDFGSSYWNSALMLREHPGLAAQGFEPEGRFGIGFFSVFMWGERVKVVTRRPEDRKEETRILDFSNGLSSRSVLRHALPSEQRIDPGTTVCVWLANRATETGGLLAPGPIGTRSVIPEGRVVRQKPWSLRDLCAWLCPAMDVNLTAEQGNGREVAIVANDWKSLDSLQLLRRLMLHRDDCDEVCKNELFRRVASNMRDVREEDGTLLGRASVTRMIEVPGSDGRHHFPPSVITSGGFRADEGLDWAGLLLGRADRASRNRATPLAFEERHALAAWASDQADLVDTLTDDPVRLSLLASFIRRLNGDTRRLPIARSARGLHSFDEIAEMRNLPDEVRLLDDLWGESTWARRQIPENTFGVAFGPQKAVSDISTKEDIKNRAHHPRWTQYWMSLWGATIEAMSLAWKAPLQDVLEASDISSKPYKESVDADGRRSIKIACEVIRRPKKHHE